MTTLDEARYAGIPYFGTVEIDERVLPLVRDLNALPDLATDSSCGGHEEPKGCQEKHPAWYVGFTIAESAFGVWSLARVVAAAVECGALVFPWFDGGLRFGLEGEREPEELRAVLARGPLADD